MTATLRQPIELAERSYDVVIGSGVLDEAGTLIREQLGPRRIIIAADRNLLRTRHPERLRRSLAEADLSADMIVVPPGEGSKSWTELSSLVEQLLDLGVDRRSVVLALGGGVLGDLAGFASATTLRGLDFVQAPTTLLAQVDSSVGGKTGINTRHGKNLVGAFHQPRLVLADTTVLDDLPARELRAGYAELVKHAFIRDAGLFDWLERYGHAVLSGDPAARAEAIARSVAIKAAVVGEDERETSGERAVLNFGHTFAHAFETLTGYGERLLHGEAVSLGMVKAFRLSHRLGFCPGQEVERAVMHLEAMGLPVRVRDLVPQGFAPDRVMQAMLADKKTEGSTIRFVLARGIGDAFSGTPADEAAVREVLARDG
jgi:3-dehydroquinate synthase